MRNIGKNIKDLRLKKNLSQDQLAESLFVTRQTISNYETGRSHPDIDMLVNIADLYEIDVHTLIYGDEEPFQRPAKYRIAIIVSFLVYIIAASAFIYWFGSYIREYTARTFEAFRQMLFILTIRPVLCLLIGGAGMGILFQMVSISAVRKNSKLRPVLWVVFAAALLALLCLITASFVILLEFAGLEAPGGVLWSAIMAVITFAYTQHWYIFIILGMIITGVFKIKGFD